MPILTQRAVLLAKVETTAGTDAAPTAASNAVLVTDPQFTVEAEEVTRTFARADFSNYASRYVQRRGQMTFGVEVIGSGTADTAPTWAALFEGCAMAPTTTVDAAGPPIVEGGVTYNPITTALKTMTLYMYFDGIVHKMTGAMGSWSLEAEAGGIATIQFTFTGTYATPVQEAMPTPTLSNLVPPLVEMAGLKWNGVSNMFAASFSLDMGNEIALRKDTNSAHGLHSIYISGRNPTGGFTPEVSGALNDAFWADWASSTTRAFEVTVGTSNTGSLVEGQSVLFKAPAVQITGLGYGDRDNLKTYDLNMALRRGTAGNDELSVRFE